MAPTRQAGLGSGAPPTGAPSLAPDGVNKGKRAGSEAIEAIEAILGFRV